MRTCAMTCPVYLFREMSKARNSRVPRITPIPVSNGAKDGFGVETKPITTPFCAPS